MPFIFINMINTKTCPAHVSQTVNEFCNIHSRTKLFINYYYHYYFFIYLFFFYFFFFVNFIFFLFVNIYLFACLIATHSNLQHLNNVDV